MNITRTAPTKPQFLPVHEHWVAGEDHFADTESFESQLDQYDGQDVFYAYQLSEKEIYSPKIRAANAGKGALTGVVAGGLTGGALGLGAGVLDGISSTIGAVMDLSGHTAINSSPLSVALPIFAAGVAIGGLAGATHGAFAGPENPETFVIKGTIQKQGDSPVFFQDSDIRRPMRPRDLRSEEVLRTAASDIERQQELQAELSKVIGREC